MWELGEAVGKGLGIGVFLGLAALGVDLGYEISPLLVVSAGGIGVAIVAIAYLDTFLGIASGLEEILRR